MTKVLKDKPAQPFPLYRKKDEEFSVVLTSAGNEIWACGECGTLHHFFYGDNMPPNQRAAECCLQKYCKCGEKIQPGYTTSLCSSCRGFEQEQARLAKATEIDAFDGPVFDCPVFHDAQDEYWSDVESFLDDMAVRKENQEEFEVPEWIYPCNIIKFGTIDAQDIIENALSEHYDDAYEAIEDQDGLQEFLDQWCEKQTVQSWEPDYSKKINVKKLMEKDRE